MNKSKLLNVRKGFSEEHTYVDEFFANISFNTEQIGSLMQTIEDVTNEVVGAQTWIDANRELTDSCMPIKE